MIKTPWIVAAAMAAIAVSGSADAGDAAAGKKVFAKCRTCHEVDSEKNKVGPHLKGLFGRTAGAVADFKYSDEMKASGIVWSEETLKTYLADPKGNVPGTKMVFAGLKKEADIENIIEYLEEATK